MNLVEALLLKPGIFIQEIIILYFLNKKLSEYKPVQLSISELLTSRTIDLSDEQSIGLSTCRVIDLSD